MNTPQRSFFTAPERLSPAWTLRKGRRTAMCEVWSHLLGFELRLQIAGDPLPRTHVCKSQEELIATQEQWRAALEEKGWERHDGGSARSLGLDSACSVCGSENRRTGRKRWSVPINPAFGAGAAKQLEEEEIRCTSPRCGRVAWIPTGQEKDAPRR